MSSESANLVHFAAVQALIARARERNVTQVSAAALTRLVGADAHKVASAAGLVFLENTQSFMIPELSFAEVLQRLGNGEELPGIRQVPNEEVPLSNYTLLTAGIPSIPKPWESSTCSQPNLAEPSAC